MKREIKFRGLDKQGQWHYGYYAKDYIGDAYITSVDGTYAVIVIPESIGQYTELKDNDGKEIFEGDIISWSWNNGKTEIEQVEHSLDWDGLLSPNNAPFMSAWGSTCGRYFKTFMNIYDPTRYACVIGNIHELKTT